MAPATTRPSSIWDHKADKDLLLAIVFHHEMIGKDGAMKGNAWPLVAEKMQRKGYSFTKEACRQHFQKIRKEADPGTSSPSKGGGSEKSTPRKTGNNKTRNPGKTTHPFENGNDCEDDDEEMTPLKRKSQSMHGSFSAAGVENGYGSGYGYGYGDDEDEEMMSPVKRKRVVKTEEEGRNAPLFKMEGEGGKANPVDLEHEDFYGADEECA